jgi:anti-sigma B factor antagonist
MEFGVVSSQLGGVRVVEVGGEVDLFSAPDLKRTLNGIVDGGGRVLLVDLSRTTFIDSTALGVLIGVVKRLRPEGGELAIVCPDPSLRKVFEVTRLDRAFELFDSVEAALEHLGEAVGPDQA